MSLQAMSPSGRTGIDGAGLVLEPASDPSGSTGGLVWSGVVHPFLRRSDSMATLVDGDATRHGWPASMADMMPPPAAAHGRCSPISFAHVGASVPDSLDSGAAQLQWLSPARRVRRKGLDDARALAPRGDEALPATPPGDALCDRCNQYDHTCECLSNPHGKLVDSGEGFIRVPHSVPNCPPARVPSCRSTLGSRSTICVYHRADWHCDRTVLAAPMH